MRAGRLRYRIDIQQPVDVRDAAGGVARTWASLYTRRADMIPQSGRRFQALQQQYSELTHLFRVRYLAGVTPICRIVCEGEIYRVISVINHRNQMLEIMTEHTKPDAVVYAN